MNKSYLFPSCDLAKGHKKKNKGNSVKSFVYKGYDTLRARVEWKKKSMIKR